MLQMTIEGMLIAVVLNHKSGRIEKLKVPDSRPSLRSYHPANLFQMMTLQVAV